jgi:hypothetical protein
LVPAPRFSDGPRAARAPRNWLRPMSRPAPACRSVTVVAFRGDRSRAFAAAILKALDDERTGRGPTLPAVEYLLFTGHTGVSLDGGSTVYGFNPTAAASPSGSCWTA